ncbi:hypothetical protein AB1Y20_003226 [Prymnesium parvum]|uniref:nicotinamidase n=1 Tax=Prymnesium parvum TaxID=97485 RepID=A0AB34JDP5_PRYPA
MSATLASIDALLAQISVRTAATHSRADERFRKLSVVTVDPCSGAGDELEKQLKLDSLLRSMQRRSSSAELLEKGILKSDLKVAPALVAKQEALERQMKKNSLTHSISNRPSPDKLQQVGIMKESSGVAPGLVARKEELERQLLMDALAHKIEQRPSLGELQGMGIVKGSGRASGTLVDRAEQLEKRFRMAELDLQLKNRSTLRELQDKGVLKGSPGVAPRLVAKQAELEKSIRRDSLDEMLYRRPPIEELMEKGVIKGSPGVAPGLVAKQVELEKSIRRDSLDEMLDKRPPIEELMEKGVIKGSPGVAPGLVAKQAELEKSIRRDSLGEMLDKRPPLEELMEKGVIKGSPGVAPGLVAKQAELEKSIRRDSLDEMLYRRPPIEELMEKGVIKGSPGVAPGLVAKQAELEKSIRRDSLDGMLDKRPPIEELMEKGVIKGSPGVAPGLVAKQAELEKSIRRDSLGEMLYRRPPVEELMEKGVIKGSPGVAPWLVAKQAELEKSIRRDSLGEMLDKRPPIEELLEKGMIKGSPGVAPGLVAKQAELEKSIRRDSLGEMLYRRPPIEELMEKGVIKGSPGVAPGLVAKQAELEKSIRRDSLGEMLDKRPPIEELLEKGVIKGSPGVSPGLVAKQAELEKSIRRDSLGEMLYRRPPVEELTQKGVIKAFTGVSPGLAAKKGELEKSIRRDSLDEMLSRRPPVEDLLERGVLKGGPSVAPNILAMQAELEKSMKRDSLAQALDRRASFEELLQRNIIKGSAVSSRLAEASEALAKDIKRSSLSRALLARSPISELQSKGILMDTITVRAAAAQEKADRIELGMESCESLMVPVSSGGRRASIVKQSLLAKATAKMLGKRASLDNSTGAPPVQLPPPLPAGLSAAGFSSPLRPPPPPPPSCRSSVVVREPAVNQGMSLDRILQQQDEKDELVEQHWAIDGSPLLEEFLEAAGDSLVDAQLSYPIGPDDALLVIDMQNDFVPCSDSNPNGGRFGVPEGDQITTPIAELIGYFMQKGAMVGATRDYHPHDHASFLTQGGPFPRHCIQGSEGSKFRPVVGQAISAAMAAAGQGKVFVAFKAMHEDVDSFGGLPYCSGGKGRICNNAVGPEVGIACHMGCNAAPWTGSLIMKQSMIYDALDKGEAPDADAPPDVFATLPDGKDRKLSSLQEMLKGKRRLFVCGLALDFCVLDTCRNARELGFPEVYMILDMARASHIPGVGQFGSGFLSDPSEVLAQMSDAGVLTTSFESITGARPPAVVQTASGHIPTINAFPASLAPIGLAPVHLFVQVSFGALNAYSVSSNLIKKWGLSGMGRCSPKSHVPSNWWGAPNGAKYLSFASPVDGISQLRTLERLAFLSVSHSAERRFVAFGGFIFFDANDDIIGVQAVGTGEQLTFKPARPWRNEFTSGLLQADRFQPVTLQHLSKGGATQFCWLLPGEEFSSATGEKWIPCAHGGFLYLMAGEMRPIFFEIA